MIKGITYWSTAEGALAGTHPIDDALKRTKAAGFQAMELCLAAEGVVHTGSTRADCEAIRGQVEASGVVVQTTASGLSWAVNPLSDDPATRAKALDLYEAALERTAWLGAQAMLMVPGVVKSPISPDVVRYDRALERCRETVGALLRTAERLKVDLCLENVWNGMFYSPLEFANFIDSLGSERLGIYFDVGNVLGYHQHPPHWIELLGSRIKRVHLKDYQESFNWTGAYSFCDLLAGQVDWPGTMAALRGVGYHGTLIAEMLPWDPGILARTSAAMDVIMNC